MGARPKAKAGGKKEVQGGTQSEEDNEEKDEGTSAGQSSLEVPPPYEEPLPRGLLDARAKALEAKAAQCEEDEALARRKKRAELRLEEIRTALKEAGGGSTTRALLAMANANKKLGRLDSAVGKYQQPDS